MSKILLKKFFIITLPIITSLGLSQLNAQDQETLRIDKEYDKIVGREKQCLNLKSLKVNSNSFKTVTDCMWRDTWNNYANSINVAYCGISNGKLKEENEIPFQRYYMIKKSRYLKGYENYFGQHHKYVYEFIEKTLNERSYGQKLVADSRLKLMQSCDLFLSLVYPEFVRNKSGTDKSPSLQETMQDKPFRW